MQRRRRTERRRRFRRSGLGARALMALSALVVLVGLASRITGGEELSAAVIATPTPTPLTATFDETVETRQVTCPAETWYCLQTGVFSTLEAAQEKSTAYSDRGAPGYVAQDGDKYRVLLSAYGTQEEAQRVRERLDTQQAVDTYVHEMTRPELPLQLTGMRGQLDVIEAAMALLPTLADQWRDAALMVDQGEMTLEEAQRMAAESLEQCRVMLQVLNERFVSPVPALAQRLELLCTAGMEAATRLEEAAHTDLTTASAQLKMEALGLHHGMKITWEAMLSQDGQ